MNILVIRQLPAVISIANNTPRAPLSMVPSDEAVTGMCDVILALGPGSFPRQGSSEEAAKGLAEQTKKLLNVNT